MCVPDALPLAKNHPHCILLVALLSPMAPPPFCTLLRVVQYQYRYGGSFKEALDALWVEGGVPRLYQGLPFALVQGTNNTCPASTHRIITVSLLSRASTDAGPASRFGDTAANAFVLALLADVDLDVAVKTLVDSHLPLRILHNLHSFCITVLGMGNASILVYQACSLVAGGWRIVIMPIDTIKTTFQVSPESDFMGPPPRTT